MELPRQRLGGHHTLYQHLDVLHAYGEGSRDQASPRRTHTCTTHINHRREAHTHAPTNQP